MNIYTERQIERLQDEAVHAGRNSFSPYSGFRVGSAVLADNGLMYKGANIESASYGLTVCGERSAIFNAVSDGARGIMAVAVNCIDVPKEVAEQDPDLVMSCGACRQVMHEFMGDDGLVVIQGLWRFRMGELLPNAFHLPS